VSIEDQDDASAWLRYEVQPRKCVICGEKFSPRGRSTAKTCEAHKKEYERRYAREYYARNPDKIIAQTSASRRRRHKPNFKECIAPHPTKPDAICGIKFEVKKSGDGRRLTCSRDCSVRRRWALQSDRYHADPQAKRDYKNAYYAANYAQPVGKTRCPNPACGREYPKKRSNQHTCGRAVCHLWQQGIKHREKINARQRKKRLGNPVYAAYQRNYRAANQEKFKGYQPKINEMQRRRRSAARQAAIAAGTFVDRRRKLTGAQRSKIIKRRRAGETLAVIAKSYGVSIPTISRIADIKT
jgi:hypothetical protein